MSIKIVWLPDGQNIDTLGTKQLVDIGDGDTPSVRTNVRMLSIDAPEKPDSDWKPETLVRHSAEFAALPDWLKARRPAIMSPDLLAKLEPKLTRARSAEVHYEQGIASRDWFVAQAKRRLAKDDGTERTLFIRAAEEKFDGFGRLLAYVAPNYTEKERMTMTRLERSTFNFDLVESGHAASFIIYPSIPGHLDLAPFIAAAQKAVETKAGAWSDDLCLTGYEFRMCRRLVSLMRAVEAGDEIAPARWTNWVERYCCDISTAELFAPQDYHLVEPWNRLFIWPKDVRRARSDLGLVPSARLAG